MSALDSKSRPFSYRRLSSTAGVSVLLPTSRDSRRPECKSWYALFGPEVQEVLRRRVGHLQDVLPVGEQGDGGRSAGQGGREGGGVGGVGGAGAAGKCRRNGGGGRRAGAELQSKIWQKGTLCLNRDSVLRPDGRERVDSSAAVGAPLGSKIVGSMGSERHSVSASDGCGSRCGVSHDSNVPTAKGWPLASPDKTKGPPLAREPLLTGDSA
jgi:hypothetical protein